MVSVDNIYIIVALLV